MKLICQIYLLKSPPFQLYTLKTLKNANEIIYWDFLNFSLETLLNILNC